MLTEEQMKRVFKLLQFLKSKLRDIDYLERFPGTGSVSDGELEAETYYENAQCFIDAYCVIRVKGVCTVSASSILGWNDRDFQQFNLKRDFGNAINEAWMKLCERKFEEPLENELW